ncbi:MAG: tRNA dihydrouridine synthase DusB [Spirochaetia bacterium]|nr:tRNA dihydrouridine synthase DusB [Spirochaetia bacterium]
MSSKKKITILIIHHKEPTENHMQEKSYYHDLSVQGISIKGNLILAPMAGYTDKPFRMLCLEHGASITVSEMVSSEGIARRNAKTCMLMERAPEEEQFIIQIFTGELDSLERGLVPLLEANPTIIDLNCGCPVPKVIKTGAGSALMKNPGTMGKLVNYLAKHSGRPVSVKFRTGWDSESENYMEFAKIALDNGAAMLTMHARTRSQGYAPVAHWDRLEKLAAWTHEHFPQVPVIGSGDLFSPQDAGRMFVATDVDGIMFARGAIGNPSIFSQTQALLTEGLPPQPLSNSERKELILRQLNLMIKYYGENVATREMRKHCCAYLKGIPGGTALKKQLMTCKTEQEYIHALEPLC